MSIPNAFRPVCGTPIDINPHARLRMMEGVPETGVVLPAGYFGNNLSYEISIEAFFRPDTLSNWGNGSGVSMVGVDNLASGAVYCHFRSSSALSEVPQGRGFVSVSTGGVYHTLYTKNEGWVSCHAVCGGGRSVLSIDGETLESTESTMTRQLDSRIGIFIRSTPTITTSIRIREVKFTSDTKNAHFVPWRADGTAGLLDLVESRYYAFSNAYYEIV